MAQPTSILNADAQALDTVYGADGVGRLKLGLGNVSLTGLTPTGAIAAVATHLKDAAVAVSCPIVLIGYVDDSGNVIPVTLDASGNIPVAFGGVSIISGRLQADLSNEPTVFKAFSGLDIEYETAIWTPAGGMKFRLLGFCITQNTLSGDITLKDGVGGTTILIIPSTPTGQPLQLSLGRIGLPSAMTSNVLTARGTATETISGFVYGIEE